MYIKYVSKFTIFKTFTVIPLWDLGVYLNVKVNEICKHTAVRTKVSVTRKKVGKSVVHSKSVDAMNEF